MLFHGRSGVWGWAQVALTVVALGCQEGGSQADGIRHSAANTCRRVPVCDINSSSCQASIFRATACERGVTDVTMPEVISVDEAGALAVFQESGGESPGGALLPAWYAGLSALRLIAAIDEDGQDTSGELLKNVAAFYVPETKKAYIIRRDESSEFIEDMLVLSHEFVHSMQDPELELATYRVHAADSSDAFVALTAAIEGEAVVTSMLFVAHTQNNDPLRIAWNRFSRTLLASIVDEAARSPLTYFALLQGLPYPLGTDLMADAWLADGQDGIRSVYESPPNSLGGWPGAGPRSGPALTCYPTLAPEGYEAVDSDRLGPTGLAAISLVTTGNTPDNFTDDWRDDSIVLYLPRDEADDGVAVAWRIRFANAAVADEFASQLDFLQLITDVKFAVDGDEVVLLAANKPSLLEDWDTAVCGAADQLVATTWTGANMSAMASRIMHARNLQRIARHAHSLPDVLPTGTAPF